MSPPEREILKGVNLSVEEGETCVLFGPNGSGKSTLMSAIMGFGQTTVTRGAIIFKGKDITHMTVDQRAKLGIGIMMQRPPNVIGVKLGTLVEATAANGKGTTGREKEFRMSDFMDRDVTSGSPEGRSRGPSSCSSPLRSPTSSCSTSRSPGSTWRTSASSAGRSMSSSTGRRQASSARGRSRRSSSPIPGRSSTT
nr:ATP-binding cassette domain-containing protein [Candidatus Methanomethylophilus sp. 1R26]